MKHSPILVALPLRSFLAAGFLSKIIITGILFFSFLHGAVGQSSNTFPAMGNVGIGTLSPTYPLDVNGNVRIWGTLSLNPGGDQTMTATSTTGNWDFTNGGGGGWFFRWIQNGATAMTLSTNNDLLIGTTTDAGYKLTVNGSMQATAFNLPTGAGAGKVLTSDASGNGTWQSVSSSSGSGWAFGGNTVGTVQTLGTIDNNAFPLITDNTERMRITATGNVLIGKTTQTNTGYLLDVNGSARVNQMVVNTTGADFVFDSAYRLPSLDVVEKYIRSHHHLPDIASADQMRDKGVDLGDNQIRLLQKIEEMTLYILDQDKQIRALQAAAGKIQEAQSQNDDLHSRIKDQQLQINALQAQINELKELLKKP